MRLFYKIEARWLHWKHKRVIKYLEKQRGNITWLLIMQCKIQELVLEEELSPALIRTAEREFAMFYREKEKINPDAEIDL